MANDHSSNNYVSQELLQVAPFPIHSTHNGQIKLKLHSERGETKWLNITPDQFKRIGEILLQTELPI